MGLNHNPTSPSTIELHIEELILDGFAPRDRYAIAEAIERELTRLFAEPGMARPSMEPRAMARLDGGSINVRPGANPETIGAQLAQAIHRRVIQ
jgi:hypothetical protein